MPTYKKEMPDKEWFDDKFYLKDGFIFWKERSLSRGRPSIRAHTKPFTYIDDSGYYRVVLCGENYSVARLVCHFNVEPIQADDEVDHINNNKLDNLDSNLRKVDQDINKRNRPLSRNNSSGICGVQLCKKKHPEPHEYKVSEYYVARWYDIVGKLVGKNFSISKLGAEEAFKQASQYRARKIEELNQQGAGYSNTHGK